MSLYIYWKNMLLFNKNKYVYQYTDINKISRYIIANTFQDIL